MCVHCVSERCIAVWIFSTVTEMPWANPVAKRQMNERQMEWEWCGLWHGTIIILILPGLSIVVLKWLGEANENGGSSVWLWLVLCTWASYLLPFYVLGIGLEVNESAEEETGSKFGKVWEKRQMMGTLERQKMTEWNGMKGGSDKLYA